jgi:hypothetical protein
MSQRNRLIVAVILLVLVFVSLWASTQFIMAL